MTGLMYGNGRAAENSDNFKSSIWDNGGMCLVLALNAVSRSWRAGWSVAIRASYPPSTGGLEPRLELTVTVTQDHRRMKQEHLGVWHLVHLHYFLFLFSFLKICKASRAGVSFLRTPLSRNHRREGGLPSVQFSHSVMSDSF